MKKRVMNWNKKLSMVVFLACNIYTSSIWPILDGRSSILHVYSHYTFTDGESALGNVYLHDGFSLTPGTTAIFIMDSGFVDGDVFLNGGTIQLGQSLTFVNDAEVTGTGFFDLDENNVYHSVNKNFLVGTGYIKILSPGSMISLSQAPINIRNGFDLSSVNGDFSFRGGTVLMNDDVITSTAFPSSLAFVQTRVTSRTAVTFLNPEVSFNSTVVDAADPISMEALNINGRSGIGSGALLRLKELNVNFENSTLDLNNCIIDFISTGTDEIRIGASGANQGTILFNGANVFRSSTNNPIVFDESLTVEFFPGARLALEGSLLRIE